MLNLANMPKILVTGAIASDAEQLLGRPPLSMLKIISTFGNEIKPISATLKKTHTPFLII